MDREQIEADVAWFERELANVEECYADPDRDAGRLRRAIARLRADLAKMDGPAEGFVRVRIGVDRDDRAPHGMMAFLIDELSRVDEYTIAVITADVPMPRVVEVEGTVEEAKP